MWFDAGGRRIAKAHQQHGYGQPKDAWKQLISRKHFPIEATVPDGYQGPLHPANRVKEIRSAQAEFTRRMRPSGGSPGTRSHPSPLSGRPDTERRPPRLPPQGERGGQQGRATEPAAQQSRCARVRTRRGSRRS